MTLTPGLPLTRQRCTYLHVVAVVELCDQLMPTCRRQRLYTAAEPGRDLAIGGRPGVVNADTPPDSGIIFVVQGQIVIG